MDLGEYAAPEKVSHPEYYWNASGQKQGDFKNSNPGSNKKFEKYSRVFALRWATEQPIDAHTGQATGRYQLEPIAITKYVDQSSPLLIQALLTHEVIKKSEFIYVDYPQAQGGKQQGAQQAAQMTEIFKVLGEQGFISRIEAGSTAEGRLLETIHMVFNKMTWNSVVGSTQADWNRTDAQ